MNIIIIITTLMVVLFFMLPILFVILHTCLPRRRNKCTPKDFYADYENIEVITDDNLELKGWFIPNPEAKKTVLICHGVIANRSILLPVAKLFHSLGCEIYMFDFRNHGESSKTFTSYGFNEVKDIQAITSYIKNRSNRNFTIYGISMGAVITLLAAPQISELDAVIVDSPFATAHQILDYRLCMLLPKPIADFYSFLIKFYTRNIFGTDINQLAPIEIIKNIHKPILIIIGNKDKIIPPDNGHELFDSANNPKHLLVIQNADHMETFLYPEYGISIKEFIELY